MPLLDHLEELRARLIRVIVAFLLLTLLCFAFHEPLLRLMLRPAGEVKLIFTGPAESFLASLRVVFACGFYLTLPILLHEGISFVRPGLTLRERRWALPLLVASFLLFSLGVVFAYFLLLPVGLKFLLTFGPTEIQAMISIGHYIGFAAALLLATGLSFQLPLVLLILASLGIVDGKKLKEARKYALLGAFVAGGVLTPSTDLFTQALLAGALYLLYEVSILGVWLRSPREFSASP
ncbi:MAG: twin-arginine translocase subunit TatC [Bacteroidota bacterium]